MKYRYFAEVNADLKGRPIISFNRLELGSPVKQVMHVHHCQGSITPNDCANMENWIKEGKL